MMDLIDEADAGADQLELLDLVIDHLTLTLANFGSARGSVVCRVNRYAREFFYGPGLAVTVKKFTHPIFCASNHR